jgi:hypothetical protein
MIKLANEIETVCDKTGLVEFYKLDTLGPTINYEIENSEIIKDKKLIFDWEKKIGFQGSYQWFEWRENMYNRSADSTAIKYISTAIKYIYAWTRSIHCVLGNKMYSVFEKVNPKTNELFYELNICNKIMLKLCSEIEAKLTVENILIELRIPLLPFENDNFNLKESLDAHFENIRIFKLNGGVDIGSDKMSDIKQKRLEWQIEKYSMLQEKN